MNQTAKEALDVIEHWSSAFTQSDIHTIMSLFAQDAVFLGTSSKSIVTDTNGIKEYFEKNLVGSKRYTSELSDIKVHELSNDGATVTALNKITITENHHTDIALGRLSIALGKRDGYWKIVHFHRSAMPE